MDKDVASVTPTSRFCMQTVCEPIDYSKDITIVEYGAGAGVFAKFLLDKMTPDSSFIMFETNERLFDRLQKINDPRVTSYNESVEHVEDLLSGEVAGNVDFIISGIPFSFLDDETTNSILDQSKRILKKGGAFLAYQTSGHLKEPLQQTFGNVSTEWEWRNIPPMTVYKAVK
ncbi:MAG: methyltransferase [Balneolaceae bacterium]|nr:methyltransferase [Balneolaceae bacterium]